MLRNGIFALLIGIIAVPLAIGVYALTGGIELDINLTYFPKQFFFWKTIGHVYLLTLWFAFFSTISLGYVLIRARRKSP